MLTPIKKRILSIFSISIITLALLYSAVASAVQFSREVKLDGCENKPGFVGKNPFAEEIDILIPRVSASTVVTVIITVVKDGKVEPTTTQVKCGKSVTIPPGATVQIIIADVMSPEVEKLWGSVEFNFEGIENLLPALENSFKNVAGADVQYDDLLKGGLPPRLGLPPSHVVIPNPSAMERGGLPPVSKEQAAEEARLLIEWRKIREAHLAYDGALAGLAKEIEKAKQKLNEDAERAKQAAQEEYERQTQDAAALEKDLTKREQAAIKAQDLMPAVKACMDEVFKVLKQYKGEQEVAAEGIFELCRVKAAASVDVKQIREDLAKNNKAKADAESNCAAAKLRADKEAAAAKLRADKGAAAALAHAEQDLAATLERIRRGEAPAVLATPAAPRSEAAPTAVGTPATLVHEAAPTAVTAPGNGATTAAKQEPSTDAATPHGSRILIRATSFLGGAIGMLDQSHRFLPPKNDTDKDGGGGKGSPASSTLLSSQQGGSAVS